ncbi:MAG: cation:proton antiporter [Chlorobiaceae bacterium]|nr:cation:proton antiporter [Chlorobiaceae bacterium]NTV60031.1 cation:proton antiporter [Chlorobiaceae bacterium]
MSPFAIPLPLKNPVLQFSLILFIILFVPLFFKRLKIPSLVSLIIAGAVVGPNGLNLMLRDSSILLFGTVGLLYIMFLAGLEIDVEDFRKNSVKSTLFGLYTFFISITLGIVVGIYLLHFSLLSSILIGSIFASHTLILYPLISKLGIAKDKAVNISIGGTLVTDTLALLVLAVVAGISNGEITGVFWIRLFLGITCFSGIVLLLFPIIARWFFKRFDDSVLQYLFVLALVFFSGFLAEAAGVEAIIGAFLGGLALNRLIARTSPLMNRIRFVGNAIFIPFFLIGVGMLIDIRAVFKDYETIRVAVVITVAASAAKYVSAWITQKFFGFSLDQRRLIFGLISAHAAVALATVLIGYNIVTGTAPDGTPQRLLNEPVLNGTILFILVTCILATVVGQKGAHNIALAESAEEAAERGTDSDEERILIPLGDAGIVDELVNLGVTVKSQKSRNGIYALHVAHYGLSEESVKKNAGSILEKAEVAASSTDNTLTSILRYDCDVVNGIAGVIKERKITDLIMGFQQKNSVTESITGCSSEDILGRCNVTTFIYKPFQPLATIRRTILVIPAEGENEPGFMLWMRKVVNIVRHTGSRLLVYAQKQTIAGMRNTDAWKEIISDYRVFRDWDDFPSLAREIRSDDNVLIVMSRKGHLSYHHKMDKISYYLNRYFRENSFILIYPVQAGMPEPECAKPSDEPVRTVFIQLRDLGRQLGRIYRKPEGESEGK